MRYKINDKLTGKFGKIKETGRTTIYTIKQSSHWRVLNIFRGYYIIENLEDFKKLNVNEDFIKLHFSKQRKK